MCRPDETLGFVAHGIRYGGHKLMSTEGSRKAKGFGADLWEFFLKGFGEQLTWVGTLKATRRKPKPTPEQRGARKESATHTDESIPIDPPECRNCTLRGHRD